MAELPLKVKLIPDSKELDKELSKPRKLGLGIGGKGGAGGGAGGGKGGGGKGLKIAGFAKLLGLVGLGAVILEGLSFILKPIMDIFKVILTLLFLPLIPILKPVLIALGRLAAGLAPIMLKIKDAIENILTERLTGLLESIIDFVLSRVDSFVDIVLAVLGVFEAFLPLLDIVLDAIIVLLDAAAKNMKPATEFMIKIIDFFANNAEKSFNLLLDILATVGTWLEPVWNTIKSGLDNAADSIIPKLIEVTTALANVLVEFFNIISAAVSKATFGRRELGTLNKIGGDIKQSEQTRNFLPPIFIADGIIRPNGQIIRTDPRDTLIATQDPEGLVRGGGGGNFTFNITIPATINSDLDIREVAEKIAEFSKDELARRTSMISF